jgi:hypothetical protein
MAGRFRECEHSVTATIKSIARKREKACDTFPGIRFMPSDMAPCSRNRGKEAEVKTN